MSHHYPKKIISQTLLFSLINFLFFGACGVLIPFLNLHFYTIGITGVQISTISTTRALLGLLFIFLLSSLFDQTLHKRLMFQITLIISGLCMFLIARVDSVLIIMLLITINHIGISSINIINDNLSYQVAASKSSIKKAGFGSIRLFGSLSYAIAAFAGGVIFESHGIKINFLINLILIGFLSASAFLISNEVLNYADKKTAKEEKSIPFVEIWKTISNNKYLLFTVIALAITHPADNGISQFEPIFMSQLNMRESTIGLATTLSAIIEIPFFFFADRILAKRSITSTLVVIFLIDMVRRLAVFFYPMGTLLFIMKLFTSITFSLRFVSTVKLINQSFPHEYSTSSLSLITITLFGISNIISVLISGIIFDAFGGRMLYLLNAAGCLASLMFLLLASKNQAISDDPGQAYEVP